MSAADAPLAWWVLGFFVVQRSIELLVSQVHERRLMARGGQRLGHDGLFAILFAQAAWFLGMAVESPWHPITAANATPTVWLLLLVGAAAIALRWWCIATLGDHWTIEVITVPGARLVTRGPYRFLKHPNYAAVAIELIFVPLALDCWITAIVAGVLGGAALGYRIKREETALKAFRTGA